VGIIRGSYVCTNSAVFPLQIDHFNLSLFFFLGYKIVNSYLISNTGFKNISNTLVESNIIYAKDKIE